MILGDQGTAGIEITALRDSALADPRQSSREEWRLRLRSGVQDRIQIPVRRTAERHAFPLSINDQPGRHRLDSSSRQPRHDLFPQHG